MIYLKLHLNKVLTTIQCRIEILGMKNLVAQGETLSFEVVRIVMILFHFNLLMSLLVLSNDERMLEKFVKQNASQRSVCSPKDL